MVQKKIYIICLFKSNDNKLLKNKRMAWNEKMAWNIDLGKFYNRISNYNMFRYSTQLQISVICVFDLLLNIYASSVNG
jgi:hypothetical protein